jgi:hypothetical protein
MRFLPLILALSLLLTACGGPSSRVVPRERALNLAQPMQMEVLKVYDGLQHSRDPHVSHLVEVRILGGAAGSQGAVGVIGETLTFPYDEWMTGSEPPDAGSVVVAAPADWVRKSAGSKGTASPFY